MRLRRLASWKTDVIASVGKGAILRYALWFSKELKEIWRLWGMAFHGDVDFTIMISSYNSNLQALLITLKSVLRQEFSGSYEIIFADDGSEHTWQKELEDYLEKEHFSNYYFVPATKNVGTVANTVRAMKYANGKYFKGIGAGDYLYDQHALAEAKVFFENKKARFVFAKMAGYSIRDKKIFRSYFKAPLSLHLYKDEKKQDLVDERIIVYRDNISGASMFFEKEYAKVLLDKMQESGVRYSEDLLQVIVALEHEPIYYLTKPLVGYEVGTGISTNGNAKFAALLRQDNEVFDQYLRAHYAGPFIEERMRIWSEWRKKKTVHQRVKNAMGQPFGMALGRFIRLIRKSSTNRLGFLEEPAFLEEFGLSVR